MEWINAILFESWPWYIGGPLIGLFTLSVLLFERKMLGVSSSFEQFCSIALPPGDIRNFILKDTWQIWFVFGMIIGGFLLSNIGSITEQINLSSGAIQKLNENGINDFSGYAPSQLFNFQFPEFIILGIGGLLIGFGSRYAGGCTAGHSIMGIAQLAPSSILSTIGFFIGGLISTYFILPYLYPLFI